MTDDTPLRQLLDDRLTAGLTASELAPEAAALLRGMLPEPTPEKTWDGAGPCTCARSRRRAGGGRS